MIRYGDEQWSELRFTGFQYRAERRDGQWVDVALLPETADETPLPEELTDFQIIAVCTHDGHPIQLVTQDDGCDSEYQLTEWEQEQINAFIRTDEVKRAIVEAVSVRVD
ncbi:hypothetical protein B1A99_05480 [Cohnella sp. CIP 111063]|uniref:hypothetical protein n=1 Tax=unclassified Cohnella TaxID=2636738 RepID=UPI000B8BCF8A|nr:MULTISPECIES: hypothetical protein [unclassified Cohnella]OXS60982.1 hypothetical protein B1A99_05480 [Cohnella sp. CIP 111063]PRX73521.1 hypothetical protein B0G52_103118 [Cohnella sp. SGD-V74]